MYSFFYVYNVDKCFAIYSVEFYAFFNFQQLTPANKFFHTILMVLLTMFMGLLFYLLVYALVYKCLIITAFLSKLLGAELFSRKCPKKENSF